MSKMVTLDDGTEEEVWTKDEVDGLQKGSDKNKERKEVLSKLNETLELDENGDIVESISELKKSNFAKYKAKFRVMEKKLKEDGKEFDDNGNPLTGQEQMTSEKIQEMIDKGVDQKAKTTARESALSEFEGEDKKLVEHFLDKLIPLGGTFQENLDIAITKAFPDKDVSDVKQVIAARAGGRPAPYTGNKPKTFTETDKGRKMLEQTAPVGYKVAEVDGKLKYVPKK